METFKRKRVGQTAVSDNKSSSVTLNEPTNKARKMYCNFEFQQRSHTMTEINLNRAQIIQIDKNDNFQYFSIKSNVVDIYKNRLANRLSEAILIDNNSI